MAHLASQLIAALHALVNDQHEYMLCQYIAFAGDMTTLYSVLSVLAAATACVVESTTILIHALELRQSLQELYTHCFFVLCLFWVVTLKLFSLKSAPHNDATETGFGL